MCEEAVERKAARPDEMYNNGGQAVIHRISIILHGHQQGYQKKR